MIVSKKNYISEALAATNSKVDEMSPLESKFFRSKIWGKYSDGKEHHTLWEHVNVKLNSFDVRESHAWKWLDEFLPSEETYLFFDFEDDPIFYIFLENQSLVKFLQEFPISVFYLTNKNLDYLISYNDHEYLTALGTAEPWLRNKAKELSKTGWVDMDGKSYL